MTLIYLFILLSFTEICQADVANGKMEEVFSWKQIGYDFNGIKYRKSSDFEKKTHGLHFEQEIDDSEKYFIQYNNIPIGFEVYEDVVFVTVPRRRHGIPSTLNYVDRSSSSPLLKPYPDPESSRSLISVYRPRVDACHRLWAVDTGLLEVPDARRQVRPPAIVIFDLKTNKQILRYELKPNNLVNNRTTGGLTSITVDVDPKSCNDAYAYINDLATETMIVFSLKQKDSWSISHPSFKHDEDSLNFTVAGHIIPWRDGLFSTALSAADEHGQSKLYYHPLVSTQEFYVYTQDLKNKINEERVFMVEGSKGARSQSGSHAYHNASRVLLAAAVAQDAILCWNVDMPLTPEHVAVVAQDSEKLVYISDLKIVKDEVWVLVNQIPRFVYSTLDINENNFFIHKGSIPDMIKGTACEQK